MKYKEFMNTLESKLNDEQKEYLKLVKEDFEKFKYNKDTFFVCTICNFREVKNEEILNRFKNDDYDYKSDSDSKYIYTDDGVYRYSDHWNDHIASCCWFLDSEESNDLKMGFCKWIDFVPNDFKLIIYSTKKEIIDKYVKNIEGKTPIGHFYGRCIDYYNYLKKDNFGTGVEIENKKIYNFCSVSDYIII